MLNLKDGPLRLSAFSSLSIVAGICFAAFVALGAFMEDKHSSSRKGVKGKADSLVEVEKGSRLNKEGASNAPKARGDELITSIISDSLVINQKIGGNFFPDEWTVVYPMNGDTIYSLAKREGMPLESLIRVNSFTLGTNLSTDDSVIIFVGNSVKTSAPLREVADTSGISLEVLEMYNKEERGGDGDMIILPKTTESPSILRFHFLSPFSKRLFQSPGGKFVAVLPSGHLALKGDSVKAAADGLVVFRGFVEYYGQTVILKHPLNYFTVYSNLSSTSLKKGRMSYQGQKIGTPESILYFQLRQGIMPIDLRMIFSKD